MGQNRTNTESAGLSKKQREVAAMLANPDVKESKTKILEKCGVARSSFYRWLKDDPAFTEYVNALVEKYTDGELAAVWKALVERCKIGDVQAIKLFFELKGRYQKVVKTSEPVRIIDDI